MRPEDKWPEARRRALDRVRELVLDAIGTSPAAVYLIGSCARGEAVTSSDIDIAIDPRPGFPQDLIGEIRYALEDSTIPYKVDVADLSMSGAEFRERVMKSAVAWKA